MRRVLGIQGIWPSWWPPRVVWYVMAAALGGPWLLAASLWYLLWVFQRFGFLIEFIAPIRST